MSIGSLRKWGRLRTTSNHCRRFPGAASVLRTGAREAATRMIIAIPLTEDDEFSPHFGAAAKIGLYEVDSSTRTIVAAHIARPAEAEPCHWAAWLAAQHVQLFIASGMGRGAQQRMAEAGVALLIGVAPAEPRALVQNWLDGAVVAGPSPCEEGRHEGHHHHHGHGEIAHSHAPGGCGCSH